SEVGELSRSVEVAGDDPAGLGVDYPAVVGGGGQGRLRVGEAAVAIVGQNGEAVAAAIDHDEIVESGAGEVAGGQANGLLQAGEGRSGARVQAIRSCAGAEAVALGEGVLRVVQEDADITAGLVADGDVRQVIAVEVRQGDV